MMAVKTGIGDSGLTQKELGEIAHKLWKNKYINSRGPAPLTKLKEYKRLAKKAGITTTEVMYYAQEVGREVIAELYRSVCIKPRVTGTLEIKHEIAYLLSVAEAGETQIVFSKLTRRFGAVSNETGISKENLKKYFIHIFKELAEEACK